MADEARRYDYPFPYLHDATQSVAKAYRALLRDTGRMSAEELVERHLGQDIRKPAFWQGSLALVEAAVARFAQCGS